MEVGEVVTVAMGDVVVMEEVGVVEAEMEGLSRIDRAPNVR